MSHGPVRTRGHYSHHHHHHSILKLSRERGSVQPRWEDPVVDPPDAQPAPAQTPRAGGGAYRTTAGGRRWRMRGGSPRPIRERGAWPSGGGAVRRVGVHADSVNERRDRRGGGAAGRGQRPRRLRGWGRSRLRGGGSRGGLGADVEGPG